MADFLVKSSKVAQWGHSAAVRLSSATLERAAFHIADEIEIVAGDGEIVRLIKTDQPVREEIGDDFSDEHNPLDAMVEASEDPEQMAGPVARPCRWTRGT